MPKTLKRNSNRKTNKRGQTISNRARLRIEKEGNIKKKATIEATYNKCEKKYCLQEVKNQKIRDNKAKSIKCNQDITKNHKFDKYNQITKKYDFNPLHFPFNVTETSPCKEEVHTLLNDPLNPIGKCIEKNCNKEKKAYNASL
jgi:hypothetical protein